MVLLNLLSGNIFNVIPIAMSRSPLPCCSVNGFVNIKYDNNNVTAFLAVVICNSIQWGKLGSHKVIKVEFLTPHMLLIFVFMTPLNDWIQLKGEWKINVVLSFDFHVIWWLVTDSLSTLLPKHSFLLVEIHAMINYLTLFPISWMNESPTNLALELTCLEKSYMSFTQDYE